MENGLSFYLATEIQKAKTDLDNIG